MQIYGTHGYAIYEREGCKNMFLGQAKPEAVASWDNILLVLYFFTLWAPF